MSAKTTGLVWDMECPSTYNGINFLSNHKFVLVAYADHADHNGKNIWPAVETIRKKTGYKSGRSIQNITHQLEAMGILVADGIGPRGTNKWRIPYGEGGANIAPLQILQGAIPNKSLGAIPSPAIPSPANIAPELNKPEPNKIYISNIDSGIWDDLKEKIKPDIKRAAFLTWVEPTMAITWDDQTLIVAASNDHARSWLEENLKDTAQKELGKLIEFITFAQVGEE